MIFSALGEPSAMIYLWIALVVSAVCAYPILRILRAMKSRQTVSQYAPEGHAVKQGTPTMGGLIIIVGFVASMLASARMGLPSLAAGTLRLVAMFVLFAVIGFVDDYLVPRMFPGKRGLGWKQKLIMQFAASLVFAGPVALINPVEAGWAVFLILFFSNAYNLSDGLDGLAGSLLAAICFGLLGITAVSEAGGLNPVAFALIGAVIPFLFINSPPAKIFMGDVGSLPIGAVLGAIFATMLSGGGSVSPPYVPLGILSLVMVVTLVPVPIQIASVKLRKKRVFPYTPIHHAFEKAGVPESKVVWCYVLAQFVLALVAIQAAAMQYSMMAVQ